MPGTPEDHTPSESEQSVAVEYAAAAEEWEASPEAALWATTDTDGIDGEPWDAPSRNWATDVSASRSQPRNP